MSATTRPDYKFNSPTRALTSRQERKLVDYLDGRFLDLTRNFKKRSDASSTLQSLPSYLDAVRKILAFVLQIPPVDPSASLRVAYLLRLTGDALGGITGYKLKMARTKEAEVIEEEEEEEDKEEKEEQEEEEEEEEDDEEEMQSTLRDLADFLDDLDQAWVAVLKSQVWDPIMGEGVDFVPGPPTIQTNGAAQNPKLPLRQTPPSQTDLARLKSLLYAGEASLEEWMTSERGGGGGDDGGGGGGGGDGGNAADHELEGDKPDDHDAGELDISEMLDRMGVRDDFDVLFARTLNLLGGFGGEMARGVVDPGVETTME